jgi:hypothetical protein
MKNKKIKIFIFYILKFNESRKIKLVKIDSKLMNEGVRILKTNHIFAISLLFNKNKEQKCYLELDFKNKYFYNNTYYN